MKTGQISQWTSNCVPPTQFWRCKHFELFWQWIRPLIGAAYASGTVRTWNYDTGEILSTIRYSFIRSMYVLHTYVLRTKVHMYDQLIRAIVKIHRDQGEVLALSFNPHIQILATGGMCPNISSSLIWKQFHRALTFNKHIIETIRKGQWRDKALRRSNTEVNVFEIFSISSKIVEILIGSLVVSAV